MKKSTLTVLVMVIAAMAVIGTAQNKDTPDNGHVILINPFIVPESKLEESILLWEQGRDFLQQQPGYKSTALHQSISPGAQYRLINVAQWESVEAFKAAIQKMNAEANLPRIDGVKPGPELYTVIRRD